MPYGLPPEYRASIPVSVEVKELPDPTVVENFNLSTELIS